MLFSFIYSHIAKAVEHVVSSQMLHEQYSFLPIQGLQLILSWFSCSLWCIHKHDKCFANPTNRPLLKHNKRCFTTVWICVPFKTCSKPNNWKTPSKCTRPKRKPFKVRFFSLKMAFHLYIFEWCSPLNNWRHTSFRIVRVVVAPSTATAINIDADNIFFDIWTPINLFRVDSTNANCLFSLWSKRLRSIVSQVVSSVHRKSIQHSSIWSVLLCLWYLFGYCVTRRKKTLLVCTVGVWWYKCKVWLCCHSLHTKFHENHRA